MTAAEKEECKRRIACGLKHKGSKNWSEASTHLPNLPTGSNVAVWYTRKNICDGPHVLVSIDGVTAVIHLRHGRRIFSTHCIKAYIQPQ